MDLHLHYSYPSYTQAHSPASTSSSDNLSSYTPPLDNYPPPPPTTSRKASKGRLPFPHPYARLAKKDDIKRRKIWNHALEKSLFTPYEISTLGAPQRRVIYTASLESHIDELHVRLLEMGYYPIPFEDLNPYKGLNSKTAKSMVAALQHDASVSKLKLLELERASSEMIQMGGLGRN